MSYARVSRLLLSFVWLSACSRSEPHRAAPGAADSRASSSSFGPRTALLPSAEPVRPGAPLPPSPASALPVVDGPGLLQKIRDSGHRGVVINVWASWCDPCREELPMLARVGPSLAELGVPIWLVSVDDPDGYAAAKELLESLHIELESFAAAPPLQAFKPALSPDWPGMIPVSFLFDATGKLRHFWAGEVYEKELVPLVQGFVAGKPIDGVTRFGTAPGATQGAGHD